MDEVFGVFPDLSWEFLDKEFTRLSFFEVVFNLSLFERTLLEEECDQLIFYQALDTEPHREDEYIEAEKKLLNCYSYFRMASKVFIYLEEDLREIENAKYFLGILQKCIRNEEYALLLFPDTGLLVQLSHDMEAVCFLKKNSDLFKVEEAVQKSKLHMRELRKK